MSATAPAAGWFPDPSDPAWLRWWDGAQWTEHLHQVGGQAQAGSGTGSLQEAIARQQAAQDAAAAAAAAARDAARRWPEPPLDAPLFPVNSYTKGAHASLRSAHRAEFW
jgi:hypothetical protein